MFLIFWCFYAYEIRIFGICHGFLGFTIDFSDFLDFFRILTLLWNFLRFWNFWTRLSGPIKPTPSVLSAITVLLVLPISLLSFFYVRLGFMERRKVTNSDFREKMLGNKIWKKIGPKIMFVAFFSIKNDRICQYCIW